MKLEVGLGKYSLIDLLGASGPNVVPRPQTRKLQNFLKFS